MLNKIQIENLLDENRKSINLTNAALNSDDIKHIVKLLSLRRNPLDSLNLTGNNIGNNDADQLSCLRNVRYLILSANDINDDGIDNLLKNASIVSLDICANNLSDIGAQKIINLSRQKWINAERNNISPHLLEMI